MSERPLLPLLLAGKEKFRSPSRPATKIQTPSKERQIDRLGARFQALDDALKNKDALQLRDDPNGLAPERVLVFETAGSIQDIKAAIRHVPDLELLVEAEEEFEPNEDFYVIEKRKGQDEEVKTDKPIPGRLYVGMPSLDALERLLQLWHLWRDGIRLPHGSRPFEKLLSHLIDIRSWGPQDRVPQEAIDFWRLELPQNPNGFVRVDIEMWFYESEIRRRRASREVEQYVQASGGQVVHERIIREIAYHGALVDIPHSDVQGLVERRAVRVALIDGVKYLRPQSLLISTNVEGEEFEQLPDDRQGVPKDGTPPIAALFDGVPIAAHLKLRDRLILDDPEDLQSRVTVEERRHGTEMASLIVHGDLNTPSQPLERPLFVRPLLRPSPSSGDLELTDPNRLVVDVFHEAVLRMKTGDATAPTVFLVNLSVGDRTQPFSGVMSPLARLIDYLSYRYNILFLISGGNVLEPLLVSSFSGWTAFEDAPAEEREWAVIQALDSAKWRRTLLSPAESINALTIGAHHHDNVDQRKSILSRIDPLRESTMPNITSPLGLGFRRAIKPELLFPGGREHVKFYSNSNGLEISVPDYQRQFGLKAAGPNSTGDLANSYLTGGTSAATALATRAAHQIFDSLWDGADSVLDWTPEHYAVVVKALLVHRARWRVNAKLIRDICGPDDGRRHREQSDNVARFLGFGIPTVAEMLECDSNRATLVGFGDIFPEEVLYYAVPVPACLLAVTHPRSLTVTLAWFSPIQPRYTNYRQARLEVSPVDQAERLGVQRESRAQPEQSSSPRGTVFHARYFGTKAVPFSEDGYLSVKVLRRKDVDGLRKPARFGIAVTIESQVDIPIYTEIRERLRVATLA